MNKYTLIALLLASTLILSACTQAQTHTTDNIDRETIEQNTYVQATLEPDGIYDCPKDLVRDEYPGNCRLYEDSNNDGICDHSQ